MGSSPSATDAAVPGLSHSTMPIVVRTFIVLLAFFTRSSGRVQQGGSDRFAETPPISGSLLLLGPIFRGPTY